jgi:hypothetical protein
MAKKVYFKRPGGVMEYDKKLHPKLAFLDSKYERCGEDGKPLKPKKAEKEDK